jgi:DNA polymerase III subunit chi
MTEVLFYHLDRLPLERVLPGLLERCIERQWRVVVQVGSDERCAALDAHLWTYRDDAFLPHGAGGSADASNAQLQPIWLTTGDDNPNRAEVRFLTDGVKPQDYGDYQRVVMLFDGNDADAVEGARAAWREAKADGHSTTYWQEDERGKWVQKG